MQGFLMLGCLLFLSFSTTDKMFIDAANIYVFSKTKPP